MTNHDLLRWQLLGALASGALLASACGGNAANSGTSPSPLTENENMGGATSTTPTDPTAPTNPTASGGEQAVVTPTDPTMPVVMPTDPTTPVTTPTNPSAPMCEFGSPNRECKTREQMESNIRYGTGQIPISPEPTQAEIDASFLPNGCADYTKISDGCCNPAQGPGEPEGDTCCYTFCTGACCGRPLVVDGVARVGEPVERADWLVAFGNVAPSSSADKRQAAAAAYVRDALMEHASVASFARFGLELLALGAPPELVADAQRAALDEIEHAKLCFGIAHQLSGEHTGPGALSVADAAPRTDLVSVAQAVAREGCVGETIAAAVVRAQAAECRHPEIAAALTRIAQDEERHAALAWRFVGWAVAVGGRAVQDAVQAAFADELTLRTFPNTALRRTASALADWHALGRLDEAELAAIEDSVKQTVIAPCAARLFGAEGRAVPEPAPSPAA